MAGDNSSSQDLLVVQDQSGNDVSFPQHGTIDWTALSQVTVTGSLNILGRVSKAGLDAFTIGVAQVVSSKFQLSKLGEHRLSQAVTQLPSCAGFRDVVWFGFGLQYVTRSLTKTVQGRNVVMLCASLVEIHSVEHSAAIMSSLFELYSAGRATTLRPSLQQWTALVRTCSGVLAASPFPVVAEQFMSTTGQERIATARPGSRIAGDEREIARALDTVARLSNGTLKAAKLQGGSECGFVAAVAHYFFEIEVDFLGSDGEEIGLFKCSGQPPKLTVLVESDPSRHGFVALASSVASETYVIHDLTSKLFQRGSKGNTRISGRVPPDSALSLTFGRSFAKLTPLTTSLGPILGSAARIFQGIATAEAEGDFTSEQLRSWCAYSDDSVGQGYVNCVISIFPELAHLRGAMEAASTLPYKDALRTYQSSQASLSSVCSCDVCSDPTGKTETYCLALLSEVIVRAVLCISNAVVDHGICLSRAGLEDLYIWHRALFKDRHKVYRGQPRRESGALLALLDFNYLRYMLISLYTGRPHYANTNGTEASDSAALVSGGLVFYLGILLDVTDRPEQSALIHVIPGRIETDAGRTFDCLLDDDGGISVSGEVTGPERVDSLSDIKSSCATQTSSLMRHSSRDTRMSIEPYVEESANCLTIRYYVHGPQGSCSFGPLAMVRLIIRSSGLVYCPRKSAGKCKTLRAPLPAISVLTGDGEVSPSQLAAVKSDVALRRVENDPVARCAALIVNASRVDQKGRHRLHSEGELSEESSASDWTEEMSIDDEDRREHVRILQGDECVSCCIRAAIRNQGENTQTWVVLKGQLDG